MLLPLDGPSKSFLLSSVGVTTPIEVKAGATSFSERKVITLQGDAKFYIYFADDGEVPTASDLINKGLIQYKNSKESYEATGSQIVYVLAETGTVNIRGVERA